MKVGPTERICLLSVAVPLVVGAGADAVASGGACVPSAVAGAPPFLAEAGGDLPCERCCIRFALSSVTMMSPRCSAAALSSIDFNASAQVWPGALQEQEGLNSVRNRNAFGS